MSLWVHVLVPLVSGPMSVYAIGLSDCLSVSFFELLKYR